MILLCPNNIQNPEEKKGQYHLKTLKPNVNLQIIEYIELIDIRRETAAEKGRENKLMKNDWQIKSYLVCNN